MNNYCIQMKNLLGCCFLLAWFPAVAFACDGDISGFWEKRAKGSKAEFQVFEEFRIDSASGVLSVCGSDREWHADFKRTDETMSFVFARRPRVLTKTSSGDYIAPSWTAEHQGVFSEYRVRVSN